MKKQVEGDSELTVLYSAVVYAVLLRTAIPSMIVALRLRVGNSVDVDIDCHPDSTMLITLSLFQNTSLATTFLPLLIGCNLLFVFRNVRGELATHHSRPFAVRMQLIRVNVSGLACDPRAVT